MKEKIKNLFAFIKSSFSAGPRGKIGLLLVFFSLFLFVRIFFGEQNIQGFVVNAWRLSHERHELSVAENKLYKLQHHIYLLQHPNNSADYIEELGLKTLNLGNPEFKELKY